MDLIPGDTTPERTLVLLKPDAVVRGISGRVLSRFEDAGFKIVGVKMARMDAELVRRHYFDLEERLGRSVYERSAVFMQQAPVIAVALEGHDVVATVRKMVGASCPDEAAPGTIRGDLAHDSRRSSEATGKGIANVVHASSSRDEAAYELGVWFSKEEIHGYRTLLERFIR
ncbi:nucleoside-diphosphate kinase [Streptomyces sp. WM4235]|uniref:nucleoside-diphosphate kinase n=1 Tax=Streptomyces sp. WM4235 TaxID=1415551 RepID=UPI000AE0BDD4|nr:nucleoside-diphosphate kinase [Streptomyces sp. WM4235]